VRGGLGGAVLSGILIDSIPLGALGGDADNGAGRDGDSSDSSGF
jgi:hypothetical protein